MSEERLLVEERDEYGVIRVIESGDYRFLEFGDGVEQSCVFMPDPAWLEYDYTRSMLLGGLCHSQPRRALFLGSRASRWPWPRRARRWRWGPTPCTVMSTGGWGSPWRWAAC